MSAIICPDCGKLASTSFPLHDCKPRLLAFNSPTYLRRLVREINAQKITGARLYACDLVDGSKRSFRRVRFNGASIEADGTWYINPETVENDNGQSVCASRSA